MVHVLSERALESSYFLKRRGLGLKLAKEWLMSLSILRGEVIDKQDAVQVVVFMLCSA
jgi:hypothetical protein